MIKGILLHQGCSNNTQQDWPVKVKKIYNDILTDLNLKAEDVPLFAGELVSKDMGGACWGHNPVINTLPDVIPTSHVISSANLPNKGDGLHFTSHSYRVLGCRYATKALQLMGIKDPVVKYSEEEPTIPKPEPSEGDFVFDFKYFDPTIWENGTFDQNTHTFVAGQYGFGGWQYDQPIDLSGYQYLVAELEKPQTNGAALRVFDTASYWEEPYSVEFQNNTLLVCDLNGMMKPVKQNGVQTGITPLNTKKVYRVGFWAYGNQPIVIKQVFATNKNPYDLGGIDDVVAGVEPDRYEVYNLQGVNVMSTADRSDLNQLPGGLYVINGVKYLLR